jgi:hypothetical protein
MDIKTKMIAKPKEIILKFIIDIFFSQNYSFESLKTKKYYLN